MAAVRRCPVCQGTLFGVWGEAPASNRRYCSAACRQTAYRRRATSPAERRRTRSARTAAVTEAAGAVEQLLDALEEELQDLRGTVSRGSSVARAVWRAGELAQLVERLTTAAIGYDRAVGLTWAELAEDAGVDESTLRRRLRAAGTETLPD
jgi:hypothetical protein